MKDVGVGHLVLQRDTQKVKLTNGVLRLQGKERNVLLPHDFVQIGPGRIDAFTPDVLPLIEHIVQDLDAQMGHAYFVDVRKTHGKTNIYLIFIFHHCVDLISEIPGRFIYLQQNFIRQS